MVDSASGSKVQFKNDVYDFSIESNKIVLENFVKNLQAEGNLSEEEIKFLSFSKEKKSSAELLERVIYSPVSFSNFEEVFCLQECTVYGGTVNPEQAVRNVRYKDKSGNIVATVQIDTISRKIRVQNFGNILPKSECLTPSQVGTKIQNLAKYNNWIKEDGGVNRFNGNIEVRYKNSEGYVMAAVITKDNGVFDTVVEYEYISGNRSKMILTNSYGNSIVVYDGTELVNQTVRIDIDNDGTIVEITKVYVD